jgi:tetratricopeptide (TPR) repeat protein
VRLAPVALALCCAAAPLGAQEPGLLERAERALQEGRTAEARELLTRWRTETADSAAGAEEARGWYLSGRLALDAAEAELYYLRVLLDASDSRYADDALLRLAQYQLALGNAERAESYLRQLRRDYPTSELGAEALLWLSHAKKQAGDFAAACDAANQGLNELTPGAANLRAELVEALQRCREPVRPPAATAAGYSVQVAALSTEEGARALTERLREAGFDAWVQPPGTGRLHRVRVGRGLSEADAQRLAHQLVAAGYTAFLVSEGRR